MQNRRQILSQIACGMAAAALPFGARADALDSAKILAGFAPGGTIDRITELTEVISQLAPSIVAIQETVHELRERLRREDGPVTR